MGSEEIQRGNLRLRWIPQAKAERQREAHKEGQHQIQMRSVQESTPDHMYKGKEVRTYGVIP